MIPWALELFKFTGDTDGQSGLKTVGLEQDTSREAPRLSLHVGHNHSLLPNPDHFTKLLK